MSGFKSKVSDDFGPQTLDAFVDLMTAKWEQPGYQTWSISADGELGGLVSFERLSPWLGTAHLLLKPGFHGKGVALEACRMAAAEIFRTGIGKLAFYPMAGNLAIGSLIVNLGGQREGCLKGHTLIGGKPADVWMYGLTKEDFTNGNRTTGSHAHLISDRRGSGSGGERVIEPEEDLRNHPLADSADANPARPATGTVAGDDAGPGEGSRADTAERDGSHQPALCGVR